MVSRSVDDDDPTGRSPPRDAPAVAPEEPPAEEEGAVEKKAELNQPPPLPPWVVLGAPRGVVPLLPPVLNRYPVPENCDTDRRLS